MPAVLSLGIALQPSVATAPAAGLPQPWVPRAKVLFSKHCAACHGPTGAGDGRAGLDLDPPPSDLRSPDVADESSEKLFRLITRGRRPMPSFARLLTDDERHALVAFVKSLANANTARHEP